MNLNLPIGEPLGGPSDPRTYVLPEGSPPASLAGHSFLSWNHPLRNDAERLAQRYNDYAQTHLPSDNKRHLAELFLEFRHAHWPANESR